MSLIEQAAEKLELLKKGVTTLPTSGKGKLASDASASVGTQSDVPTPERAVAAIAARNAEPQKLEATAPAVLRPRHRQSIAGDVASTRRVDLDLRKLSAAGFITPDAKRSQLADEFRVIKRPLIANAKRTSGPQIPRANLIMVTSALPGEGKSFTSVNLAMSIAMELDSTVLLVDGDVAGPSLSRLLGSPRSPGLIEVLTDERLTLADALLKTNVEKLSLVPAGAAHDRSTELLASQTMIDLLDEMASRYPDRIIVFDSPPLLATTESRVLATHMGQVVVVVEAEKTTHSSVTHALSTIEKCEVVMMVLNKAPRSEVGRYYGYYHS
jgi:protein-tyrosine kinase